MIHPGSTAEIMKAPLLLTMSVSLACKTTSLDHCVDVLPCIAHHGTHPTGCMLCIDSQEIFRAGVFLLGVFWYSAFRAVAFLFSGLIISQVYDFCVVSDPYIVFIAA